jgi:glycosyltransferase involved in cell wall biosynthesis
MPALILHIITGLNDGGAEAVLYRLCTYDRTAEHHVISLTDHGKYGPLLEAAGVSVTSLHMPRGKITLLGLWKLWRITRKSQPDVVQTWMYHANLVGGVVGRLAAQQNIVWGVRNTTLVPGESRRSTILVAKLCAPLSRLVPRKIVYCAQRAREVHEALGYTNARMAIIPNGYDLSVFRPDAEAGQRLRYDLAIDPAEHLIGFVARYDPQKDHETLFGALSLLNNTGDCPKCLLVGTGMEVSNASLVKRVSDLKLDDRVILLGRRTDIPAIMNALDLHVMSSAFGEAFPNVLAEAMACGTPCVSTDVGDVAAILGGTGLIVPRRAPDALAAAISELLAEALGSGWQHRKEAARNHILSNFSIQRMIKSYKDVWFEGLTEAKLIGSDGLKVRA